MRRSAGPRAQLAPTVETTRIGKQSNGSEDPTQEVPIEELGLDVGSTASLDDADDFSDMFEERPRVAVEDTVENPRIPSQAAPEDQDQDQDEDILSATGMFSSDQTGIVPALDPTNEMPTLDAEGDDRPDADDPGAPAVARAVRRG